MMSRHIRPLLAAAALAACGGPDGPGGPDPSSDWSPTQAEIDQAIAAWQAQPIKSCSLDAVFPKLTVAHDHTPREGWDLAVVTPKLDANLIATIGDQHVMFATFPGVAHDGDEEYQQTSKRTRSDGAAFEASLGYHNGHCTITVGGRSIYDGLLRTAQVTGLVPAKVDRPVALTVVAAKDAPPTIGTVGAGAAMVDVSSLAAAIDGAVHPGSLDDRAQLAALLGPLWQLTPDRAQTLLAPGPSPMWRDVLVPQSIALPVLGLARETPVTYRSVILTDTELTTLRGAGELHLVWEYANSSYAHSQPSTQTSQIEVVLTRTGDLQYQLTSLKYLGAHDKVDARAAACAADHLDRLVRYASAVPAGSYTDDVEPCANLGRDLVGAIAADPAAATTAVKMIGDAYRAKAPAADPHLLAPSDGGRPFGLAAWDELYEPLLVALEAHKSAALGAEPSRLVSGFRATAAALDGHGLGADARAVLMASAAGRAIDAAAPRSSDAEDYRPLTQTDGSLIGAAVRGDTLSERLAVQAAQLVRFKSSAEIDNSAALSCLAGATLDGQRAALEAFAELGDEHVAAHDTWVSNVVWSLLGWSYDTGATNDIAGTYCKADFVGWARDRSNQAAPACSYGGTTFDRNDYCAK
jgi:hypothetical protein